MTRVFGRLRLGVLYIAVSGPSVYCQPTAPAQYEWREVKEPVSLRRDAHAGPAVTTHKIECGNLAVLFRDNSRSPEILGGIDTLLNRSDAPGFDAFDPDLPRTSAGLNFEHIISGHSDPHSSTAPRKGPYTLHPLADGASVMLVREPKHSPWGLASAAKYTVVAPHYIDYEFRCIPHAPERFGERGYALLFWANYMNDVADVALHFRGVARPGEPESWVSADAPEGPRHWRGGGTYRAMAANRDLEYDDDHTMPLNSWSYEWPRIAQPHFYGLAANGMVYQLMFDRLWTPEEQIRFSLFKFKLLRRGMKRPAWDFQYVITKPVLGQEYGFRARAVWKKFVSAGDCQREYDDWRKSLPKETAR